MLKFSRLGFEGSPEDASRETAKLASPVSSYGESARATQGQLSEDVELKGALHFEKPLELDCRFQGEIQADGPLTINSRAVVKAEIKAASSVTIYGKVQGNITAAGIVELKGEAVLIGDVEAEALVIQNGAVFSGTSRNNRSSVAAEAFGNIFSRLG